MSFKCVLAFFLLCSCWCALLVSHTVNAQTTVEIFVPNGPIIGDKYNVLDRQMIRFLGIPYAKPPVGKLRFRRPVPVTKWTEPIRALNWPANCVQKLVFLTQYSNKNTSEDCLYLNIWTGGVNVLDEANLRPVLFFIHGGGLHLGASSFDLYNGETLAALSHSVVVSINYRVSTMGFFYSDTVPDVKGNQGLWDQGLALKWVNENIRYFGGNPKAITLMGESAGSWSVSMHILSPVTRGLFANAIMMSGAALIKSVTEPAKLTPRLLSSIRKVGCATEEDKNITEKVVQCLEQLEADKVDDIVHLLEGDTLDFHEIAVIDGDFLPASPIEMLNKSNHKTNFNLMVSTVEDEASFLLQFSQHHAAFRKENPESISLQEAKDYLLDILTTQILKTSVPNDTITRIYFNGLNANLDSADLFRKQVSIAYGDVFVTCPTLEFAKSVFRSSPDTVKVYQWYYKAKLGKQKFMCGRWTGSCHLNELYPVFGVPFRDRKLYHNREREVSLEVINFIKDFIKTGSPGEDQSEWQSYFMAGDGKELVAPYYVIGNDHKSHSSFKFNLKQMECGLVWNKFIYDWGKY